MSVKQSETFPLNRVTYAVRASQAVLQYGVGAMVDFKDQTLMTAAPEKWAKDTVTIHDERLEKLLNVNKFGMPTGEDGHRIAYSRFPEWYFCPKCRRFKPIKKWIEEYKRKTKRETLDRDPYMVNHMRCPTCNQSLVVARIVTVCNHGHINDFPWVEWVHCRNTGGAKRICGNPDIRFKTGSSATEGLEGLIVTCEACKARASLKGAFDTGVFKRLYEKTGGQFDFLCKGRHPWKNTTEACEEFPRALQRGSSSVYFPVTASSLVIPPYSSKLTEKIDNSSSYADFQRAVSSTREISGMPAEFLSRFLAAQIEQYSHNISIEIDEPDHKIKEILERKTSATDDVENTSSVKYRAEEFDALTGRIIIPHELDRDFMREDTDISDYNNLPFVRGVSLINKIREVQALIGFSRIKPADPSESPDKQGSFVCIKEPRTDWYPAYQVRGEGIFIEFDYSAIRRWADKDEVKCRIEIINDNYASSFMGETRPRTITPEFVLLHTLSHLLIKQLSFECGYSIASVKERIYCGTEAEGKEMAGIFIYTASGDSEGTMGGLVRQGRPDTFPKIFNKALRSAMYCSNDPVCNLSLGQGRDSLNLSACYSCCLIPETSCEEFNVFLDRGCVVGTYNNESIGFYGDYLSTGDTRPVEPVSTPKTEPPKDKAVTATPDLSGATDRTDENYATIWNSLLEWSNDKTEKALLNSLIEKQSLFTHKEKPFGEADLYLCGNLEPLRCELLWKKSKVAFFMSDEVESYEKARTCDWTCFCGNDPELTAEMIADSLKEA